MQCTVKKTLKLVKKSKNNAIVQVKENQAKLLHKLKKIEEKGEIHDIYETGPEKEHGRIERRKMTTYLADEWDGLVKEFAVVERRTSVFNNRLQKWEKRESKSYYAITCYMCAEKAGEGIRGHWSIENTENWVKDVSMGEDDCRIKKGSLVLGNLRSFGLNQLRGKDVTNIRDALVRNAMDLSRALSFF